MISLVGTERQEHLAPIINVEGGLPSTYSFEVIQ
jgi:hypothetical protein